MALECDRKNVSYIGYEEYTADPDQQMKMIRRYPTLINWI